MSTITQPLRLLKFGLCPLLVFITYGCLCFSSCWQVIEQTKENVEKKQALTYEEMEAEREEVSIRYTMKSL